MNFKKSAILILTFVCLVGLASMCVSRDCGTVELRYACRVETKNPFWKALFFIFNGSNREFLWREKIGYDGENSQEILIFNANHQQVVRFFRQGGDYEADINFGSEDNSAKLTVEQAKIWFDVYTFARSAQPGEKYVATYPAKKSNLFLVIEAREKVFVRTSKGDIRAMYFEGCAVRPSDGNPENFLTVNFWMVDGGEMQGQVLKGSFQTSLWPPVVFELM